MNANLSSISDRLNYHQLWMIYCSAVQNMAIRNIWKICLECCLKIIWKYHQRSIMSLELNYNTWVILFYQRQRNLYQTTENKAGNYTKIKTTKASKRLQFIHRSGKLFDCVQSKFIEASLINIIWQVKVDLSYWLKHIKRLLGKLRTYYWNLQHYISQTMEEGFHCFQIKAKHQQVQHYAKFEMVIQNYIGYGNKR